MIQQFHLGHAPKGTESRNLNRYLNTNVYNSIVDNCRNVETIQMSTDEWINKWWYIHTVEYSTLKKNLIHALI